MDYNSHYNKEALYHAIPSSCLTEHSVARDFPARISQWPSLSDFFSRWAEENSCPSSCALLMEMALEELFTNTASYGYPHGEGTVLVVLSVSPERNFQVILADSGIPFDPISRQTPAVNLPIEEKPVGGLGIHMVKQFMDHMEYHRHLNCNIVVFSKSVSPQ